MSESRREEKRWHCLEMLHRFKESVLQTIGELMCAEKFFNT